MKKTRLLICLMMALVMLFGTVQAFATEAEETTAAVEETTEAVEETTEAVEETTEAVEETTEAVEETTGEATVDTAAPAEDSVCSATGGEHQFQEGWKTSTEQHWRYCLKCKKKIGIQAHSLGEADENYQKTCSVCGKKVDVPHEHGFATEWSKNVYTHWHACKTTYGLKGVSFCKEKSDEAEHTYGEDGLCTVCGAEDVVPEERPGDAGIKWTVIIVIGVVGVAAAAAVLLIKKKQQ